MFGFHFCEQYTLRGANLARSGLGGGSSFSGAPRVYIGEIPAKYWYTVYTSQRVFSAAAGMRREVQLLTEYRFPFSSLLMISCMMSPTLWRVSWSLTLTRIGMIVFFSLIAVSTIWTTLYSGLSPRSTKSVFSLTSALPVDLARIFTSKETPELIACSSCSFQFVSFQKG